MKKLLLIFIMCLLCTLSLFSQDAEYKKDTRQQYQKEDGQNIYDAENITKQELIKALEILGMHIRKFPLKTFDKKYNIVITMDEYENGVKINSKDIFNGDNTYYHFTDSIVKEESTLYFDYIDQIVFYLKENEKDVKMTFSTYARNGRSIFNRKKDRDVQFYEIRTYSKTGWELNKSIPLFVYASSWSDPKWDIERFCGVVDLSQSEEDTKELLDNSPHYYICSYKVLEE